MVVTWIDLAKHCPWSKGQPIGNGIYCAPWHSASYTLEDVFLWIHGAVAFAGDAGGWSRRSVESRHHTRPTEADEEEEKAPILGPWHLEKKGTPRSIQSSRSGACHGPWQILWILPDVWTAVWGVLKFVGPVGLYNCQENSGQNCFNFQYGGYLLPHIPGPDLVPVLGCRLVIQAWVLPDQVYQLLHIVMWQDYDVPWHGCGLWVVGCVQHKEISPKNASIESAGNLHRKTPQDDTSFGGETPN